MLDDLEKQPQLRLQVSSWTL